MAEKELRELDKRTAVMMTQLEALISTMDSRDKAYLRGQDLILERLAKFVAPEIVLDKFKEFEEVRQRVTIIDSARHRFSGALWLALTILGMAGGIIAIANQLRGRP